MATTVTSLEERVDHLDGKVDAVKTEVHQMTAEFAAFKGRIDTVVSLVRWIGVFVAGLAVTVIFSVVSFAHSAGKLEANVDRLKETVQQQEKLYQTQNDMIRSQQIELKEISVKLSGIEEKLKKLP